jgi:hypothetical protein
LKAAIDALEYGLGDSVRDVAAGATFRFADSDYIGLILEDVPSAIVGTVEDGRDLDDGPVPFAKVHMNSRGVSTTFDLRLVWGLVCYPAPITVVIRLVLSPPYGST